MNHRILYSLLLILFSTQAFGQFYAGGGEISLTTQGTESMTEVSTEQLVGRYVGQQNKLTFMFKTQALSLGADQNGLAFANDVLLMRSNPLFLMALNIEADRLQSGTFKDLKGMITFNDKSVEVSPTIHLVKTDNELKISIELDLDLGEWGIYAPDQSKTFASAKVHFSIKEAILTLR